jgi:hypothetical protein
MMLAAAVACCTVLELRQYTLHPGARDTLVRVFDENFIEGQEAHGMRLVGQFRDLGNPDRFVWLRGFESMDARTRALEGFYSGPVWKAHREVANATMIDATNVLLLKPAGEGTGFHLDPGTRPPTGAVSPKGIVVATIYYFEGPVGTEFTSWFRDEAVPVLASAGTTVLAQLVTEPAPNLFPRLPVREGENVFVWLAAYPDAQSQAAAVRTLESLPRWRDHVAPALRARTKRAPETLLLSPTSRSLVR